jgi:type I restriction enzyme S subunit
MTVKWELTRLDELTEADSPITYGVVKPGDSGDILFVRGGDIASGRILDNQLRTITRMVSEQYKRTLLRGGELLICLVGQPGQAAVAPTTLAGANIARQVGLIRLRREINAHFICYYLQSPDGQAGLGTYTGGAVQQVINLSDLRTLKVPTPPLTEQQRIVDILDEAFDGMATAKANAEKNRQNARSLFESHLQAVFTQRGDGWVEKRLGDLAESISTGPFGTMVHKADYVADGIPMINPMNIIGSRVVPSDKMRVSSKTRDRLSRYVLKKGDIVIGRRGEMGRCALITEKEAGWLCGTGSFFIRLPQELDGKFFVALFSSKGFKTKLEENSVGTTMNNLNHSILESLPILLPPRNVQEAIIERAEKIENETQRLESIYQQKVAALDELKQALLHQAFSGEL